MRRPHRLDPLQRDAEGGGDRRRRRGEPAGRAEQGDQVRADHAVDGVGEAEPKLLAEMLRASCGGLSAKSCTSRPSSPKSWAPPRPEAAKADGAPSLGPPASIPLGVLVDVEGGGLSIWQSGGAGQLGKVGVAA